MVAKLTEYILSAGTTGSFPQIKALWGDLKDDFCNEYKSEHAGLHAQLLAVQQSVLASREFDATESREWHHTSAVCCFNPVVIRAGHCDSRLCNVLADKGLRGASA